MKKYCKDCGKDIGGNFKFCPDCGTKLSAKKPVKTQKTKTKKTSWHKVLASPKRNFVLAIVAIVVIVAVVGAAYLVVSPDLSASVTTAKDRVFELTIENGCEDVATCYITVDGFRQGMAGVDFEIPAGEAKTFNILEKDLKFQRDAYKVDLFATLDYMEKATAMDITELASFTIEPALGNEFAVTNTEAK